jgi:hypothetical protein
MARLRTTRVLLAAAHLDHDPANNRLRNLRSLCQRCHMLHDRPHHLAQRRITYLLRRAPGRPVFGTVRPLQGRVVGTSGLLNPPEACWWDDIL